MFRKKLLFLNYFVQKTNGRLWFRRVNTNLLRILRMNFLGLCKRGEERERKRHDRTWTGTGATCRSLDEPIKRARHEALKSERGEGGEGGQEERGDKN